MIVDLILDRKDGKKYNARQFYRDVTNYGEIGQNIANALDSGTNKDVQASLKHYIVENEYNTSICDYIQEQKWL